MNRLRPYIRCVQWDGKTPIECEKLFVNFDLGYLDKFTANEVIFVCHGDYRLMVENGHTDGRNIINAANDKRINKYLACSKTAQKSFYDITGVMPELCYNPVSLDPPRKILRLCSAQRMTQEKGKKRIVSLVKALDNYAVANGTEWEWDIYSNDPHPIKNNSVVYKRARPDINRFFGSYDYIVALSDAEGYCYTVVESLMRGTPVVVTPVPVFKEIGCNDKNSITLEFDNSNQDEVVKQMFAKKLKFKYTPKESSLGEYLADIRSSYSNENVFVRCIAVYKDMRMDRTVMPTEVFSVDKERAEYLMQLGLVVREGE